MRIGVDATCWQNKRGYGRHARALLSALVRVDTETHYTFFVDAPEAAASLPSGADVCLVHASTPAAQAASAAGRRSLRDMWCMSRALADPGIDLLFFPTIYTYVPVLTRARKLVMVHDVIAEALPGLTLPGRSARLWWNVKIALGRKQADAIATVSEYSRRAIVERFRLAPDRVHVIPEAPDPIFRVLDDARPTPRLAGLGLDRAGPTVTYVGGFGPHKNLRLLVDTVGRIIANGGIPDLRLVLVGEYRHEVFHSDADALRARIGQLGLGDRVVFTGYLPDEELVVLLNRSTVLALPSLMEGFGLPAVEAAACGCPVIATSASPLPDVLGEGALYVDPRRPDELEQALTDVLTNARLRQRLRAAGPRAVSRLTWEAAAHQLRAVLMETAA